MNQKGEILAVIRQKTGIIILFGILASAVSFLFLVLNEKNFKVTSDYLIVQDQSEGQDYYTLSKSAEFLGNVLSGSIYSELFIGETIKTGKINSNFLPNDNKQKLEAWSKIVKVKRNPQMGTIQISILGNNQKEAVSVSEAVSEVLTTKNYLFRGNGQNIDVRILSGPIVEKNPTIQNIFLSIFGGFFMGVLLTITGIYFFSKERSLEDIYEKEYQESLRHLES